MEEDNFRMWWDQAYETAGGDPTLDAMPQSQDLTDAQFDDNFIAELCNPPDIPWEPPCDFPGLDGVVNHDHPQIESKELTSPSSSGGITQTPSSGDFDFIRSPGSYQISHMSPHSLMESPQACFAGRDKLTPDQLINISPFTRNGFAPGTPGMVPSSEPNFNFNSPPGFHAPYMSPNSLMGSPQVCFAGSSQFTAHQINSSPYTRKGVACEALGMVPPSNVNPPPSQTIRASRKRPRRLKNIPPGMKASGMTARQWRKANKPVPCPACPMRFGYQSELDRHLVAQHRQIALEDELSLDRHVCEWCFKTFARKDGLKRHLTQQHQRQKTWRRRPQDRA